MIKQFKNIIKLSKQQSQISQLFKFNNNISKFQFCSENNEGKIPLIFVSKDGTEQKVYAKEGENILEIAHNNEIDLEGACEMSLACSTCHVILPEDIYDEIEQPEEEEEDLLDLAFGLTPTSRLGCQVKIDESFANQKIILPKATRNFYVDGHKPKPH